MENVKPVIEVVHEPLENEFRVYVNDTKGGWDHTVIISAGRTETAAISKALRTLERFKRELDRK
jgi:hypothetical protein